MSECGIHGCEAAATRRLSHSDIPRRCDGHCTRADTHYELLQNGFSPTQAAEVMMCGEESPREAAKDPLLT